MNGSRVWLSKKAEAVKKLNLTQKIDNIASNTSHNYFISMPPKSMTATFAHFGLSACLKGRETSFLIDFSSSFLLRRAAVILVSKTYLL